MRLDERYARSREYVGLLRQAGPRHQPFDHQATPTRSKARAMIRPVNSTIPIFWGEIVGR
ncbi:MAG: hypothetical protein U5M50_16070 [Sphingobium sp.]|nr:hypothetical protein [Sphingobium sp.]